MNKKHVLGYAATAAVALTIGSATGDGGGSTTRAGSATAASVPGATATAPVATQTVTVQAPARPAVTVTVGPPKAAAAMPGDGTYQVGIDVRAGTSVSDAPASGNCYWARLTGSDSLDGIIANGNSSGRVVVTIKTGDKFFESSGCSDWTKR